MRDINKCAQNDYAIIIYGFGYILMYVCMYVSCLITPYIQYVKHGFLYFLFTLLTCVTQKTLHVK